jgi:DNA-directed RNA polymerase specialized sigma24 family protein
MSTTCAGSVTRWIGDLKSGGDAAAQQLWERYFTSLVRLARKTLRGRAGAAEDEEDAALSAIRTVCRRAAQGRFPRLDDRDDLWRLLVVITVRKAFDQIQRRKAKKRGGDRVIGEADLWSGGGSEPGAGLDGFAGAEPSPELAAMVVEEYQRLWTRLPNDSLRLVLDLTLEGYTKEEIAERMKRTVRSVARKLEAIRELWLELEDRS